MSTPFDTAPQSLEEVNITSPDGYQFSGYPHDHWAYLREHAPVFRYQASDEELEPFWAITRWEDIQHISRNPQVFSSQTESILRLDQFQQAGATPPTHHLLDMDPPEHSEYRALVNRRFTTRGLRLLEDRIDEVADEVVDRAASKIVDEVARRGACEAVADISNLLPLVTICELLGVPRESESDVIQWVNEMVGAGDPEYQRGRTPQETLAAATQSLLMFFMQLSQQKREQPTDDLLSTLVQAEIKGAPLNPLDLMSYCYLLIIAGNETTRNTTTGGLLALLQHPEQMALLRSDPSLMESAVEEILRWVSPVIHFVRLVTEDVEIGGQTIPAGDKIVMFYPSANRDEDVFEHPFEFDITRSPNEHLAFGGFGEHYCIGANLARLQLRTIFSKVLERMDEIELDGDFERLRSGFVGGIKRMPIRYRAVS